jgi:hypothetical protein
MDLLQLVLSLFGESARPGFKGERLLHHVAASCDVGVLPLRRSDQTTVSRSGLDRVWDAVVLPYSRSLGQGYSSLSDRKFKARGWPASHSLAEQARGISPKVLSGRSLSILPAGRPVPYRAS